MKWLALLLLFSFPLCVEAAPAPMPKRCRARAFSPVGSWDNRFGGVAYVMVMHPDGSYEAQNPVTGQVTWSGSYTYDGRTLSVTEWPVGSNVQINWAVPISGVKDFSGTVTLVSSSTKCSFELKRR